MESLELNTEIESGYLPGYALLVSKRIDPVQVHCERLVTETDSLLVRAHNSVPLQRGLSTYPVSAEGDLEEFKQTIDLDNSHLTRFCTFIRKIEERETSGCASLYNVSI